MDRILCEYGCGIIAKYKLKNGKYCCSPYYNSCSYIRYKNSNGLKLAYKEGKREKNVHFNGNQGWAKGLTKETDLRLKNLSNSLKEYYSNNPKEKIYHREETKQIISEKRINFLENNPNQNIKWYDVDGIKVQGKWELNTALWLNKLNYKWNRKRLEFLGHRRYTPDFYLPELNIYIEVKGFMRDRDIHKMYLVLDEYDLDIRIIGKTEYNKLNTIKNIYELPKFTDLYKRTDIDFTKFNDYWTKTNEYNSLGVDRRKHKKNKNHRTKVNKYNSPNKNKKNKIIKGKSLQFCNNCNIPINIWGKKYCSYGCYRDFITKGIPDVSELLLSFKVHKSFSGVGRFYGVSDNTIRKWCKKYNILDSVKQTKK